MYSDKQKRQHIIELQKYLHAIATADKNISDITPNGIYGEDTQKAVKSFQHEYNLTETGNTDPATWDKVVEVYKGLFNMKPEAFSVFPSEKFICESGAGGQLVYIIQTMLYSMAQRYDNFPKINICGSFDDETATAVNYFQKICGIAQNGKVDCTTWNMLVNCSCHIE